MDYAAYTLPPITKGLVLKSQIDNIDPSMMMDGLDVTFSSRGSFRTRDGYGVLTDAEGTNRYDSMAAFYTTSGTKHLVCGAGNRLEAVNVSGGVVASSTGMDSSLFWLRFKYRKLISVKTSLGISVSELWETSMRVNAERET